MAAATEKTAKPASKRATTARAKRAKSPSAPTHAAISERAYFLSLQPDASDELGNWVRAERELAAAA